MICKCVFTVIVLFIAVEALKATPQAPQTMESPSKPQIKVTPLIDTSNRRVYWETLMEQVRKSRSTINVLMGVVNYYPQYPQGLQRKLLRALQQATERGVVVKVILDNSDWSTHITKTNLQAAREMRERGLRVKFDAPEVTTHAKLIIFDEEKVLLGSSNWNYSSYTESIQTDLLLRDRSLAKFYNRFFSKLWAEQLFSLALPPDLLPSLSSSDTTIIPVINWGKTRLYEQLATKIISQATQKIQILMFRMGYYPSFGDSVSNRLLAKLIQAAQRGVTVRVILDNSGWSETTNETNRKSAWWLEFNGVNVQFDSPQIDAHSKLVIVDGNTILVGSTNWTYYSLTKNVEIDLLIANSRTVARPLVEYFQRLWRQFEPVK